MKRYIIPMVLGVILLGFGCCYLWFEIMNLNFINQEPDHSYRMKQATYEFTMVDGGYYRFLGENVSIELKTSDELTNTIQVTGEYYPEFGELEYVERSYYESKPVKNITFYTESINGWNTLKQMYRLVLDDLKDRTIHNYNLLFRPKIVVTVPESKGDQVSVIEDRDPVEKFFQSEVEYDG